MYLDMLLATALLVGVQMTEGVVGQDNLPRTRVIRTKYGQVQGRIHRLTGVGGGISLPPVEIYQGIPYATPPVGSNRWQPTRAPSPWEGILQATSPGPVCPQKFPDIKNETEALLRMPKARLRFLQLVKNKLLRQSEDCLYLNIFVPSQETFVRNDRKAFPVMVYVHGESFKWGSGNLWDARVLSAFGDVVIITFNFRLGVLGFLNVNDSPLRRGQVANYGIMDQMAVLQWIQENALSFNGDPKRVTLFGHGTGAACIEFLAHSPTTVPGLFHRVILMSGSLFAPWSRVREPLDYALQLAKKFDCIEGDAQKKGESSASENLEEENSISHNRKRKVTKRIRGRSNAIIECLRKKSAEDLMGIDLNVPSFHLDFGPSFDGVTIKDNFADIKGKRSFGTRTYEAIVGVVSHDYFNDLSDEEVRRGIALNVRDRMLQTFVRNQYKAHLQEILLTLQNEYTDWAESVQHPSIVREQVLQAFSDALYVSPAVFSVGTFFRKSKNTFFYHFSHQTKAGPYSQYPIGSTHGSELQYVFGIPLKNIWNSFVTNAFTRNEALLSQIIMKYWTNFAKSGDPNKNDDGRNSNNGGRNTSSKSWITPWQNYDERQKILDLGIRPHSQHHYRGHKMSVWLNLIPQLQKTGQHAIFPSHNSLTTMNNNSPTWGIVLQNASIQSQPSVLQPSPGSGSSAPSSSAANCITLADSQQVLYQQNDTLIRLEEASRNAYSYALGITVGLGSVLCLLNGLLILCLCSRGSGYLCCRRRSDPKTISSNASSRSPSLSSANSRHDYQQQRTPHNLHQMEQFSSLPRRGGQRTLLLTHSRRGSSNEISTFSSPANSGHATVSRRTMPKPILRDKSSGGCHSSKVVLLGKGHPLPNDTIPAPAEFDPLIPSSSVPIIRS